MFGDTPSLFDMFKRAGIELPDGAYTREHINTASLVIIAISLKRIADMMAADKAEIDAISAAFQNAGGA